MMKPNKMFNYVLQEAGKESGSVARATLSKAVEDSFSQTLRIDPALSCDNKLLKRYVTFMDMELRYAREARWDIFTRGIDILRENLEKKIADGQLFALSVSPIYKKHHSRIGFEATVKYIPKQAAKVNSLTFAKLRRENEARNAESFPGSDDWIGAQWMTALCGEVGEAANIIKKMDRGDYEPNTINCMPGATSMSQAKGRLAKELADCQMYLDHVAAHYKIDLEQAVKDKFDEVSARVKSSRTLRIDP